MKALLKKYIQYIKDIEGTDYIHMQGIDYAYSKNDNYMSDVKFTKEEWEILKSLSKEK